MSYLVNCWICNEPFFTGRGGEVCKLCHFADGMPAEEPKPAGFRKVQCPSAPCRWPRCNCGIDLVYAPKLKGLPRR